MQIYWQFQPVVVVDYKESLRPKMTMDADIMPHGADLSSIDLSPRS